MPPKKGKRKGGVHQRKQQTRNDAKMESHLFVLLMTQLAWGSMSCALCHSIAKAATLDMRAAKDGAEFPDLEHLGNLAAGKAGNVWRDVMQKADAGNMPKPYKVSMPYSGGPQPTSILLPHEYFAAMHDNPIAWAKAILSDSSKVAVFWDTVVDHPMMQGHPVKLRPDYRNKCIPLAMHGDEVPITGVGKVWAKCTLMLSWFSILANALGGGTLDIMIYIWGVFEKFVVASTAGGVPGTMKVFWSIMRWSFGILFAGKRPTRDWRGIELHCCITCELYLCSFT